MARENEVDYRPKYAYWGSIAVTTSDTTVLAPICRNLYAAGAGTVKIRLLDGSTPTFTIGANSFLNNNVDLQFDQVFQNGTSATGIIALY